MRGKGRLFWWGLYLLGGVLTHAQVYDPTYSLELLNGPVVAPARLMGMGGAVLGVAEGSASMQQQPAAVANRFTYNGDVWFDYDFDYGVVESLAQKGQMDIENNGRTSSAIDSGIQTISFLLNFGKFGIGVSQVQSSYTVCPGGSGDCAVDSQVKISGLVGGLNIGYNFFSGQLVAGFRWSVPTMELAEVVSGATIQMNEDRYSSTFGFLWKPTGLPFRVGLTASEALNLALQPTGATSLNGVELPQRMGIPAQIGIGVAVSLGPRPLNPAMKFGGGKYKEGKGDRRRYLLLGADLVYTEKRTQAASLEAWIDRELQVVGLKPSYSLHVGAETELWPQRLKLRIGSYYEPSRVTSVGGRVHYTSGLELRLFKWIWNFAASAAVDLSTRYSNSTVGVTFWH